MYSCTGCQNANNEDKAHLHLSPVVVIFFLYVYVFFKRIKIRSSVIYFHVKRPFKKFIQSGSRAAWWLSVVRGGGSTGAYEVGALRCLYEHGYEFDVIVGTSIGALNGAMLAQGSTLDELQSLWLEITPEKVMKGGINLNSKTITEFDVRKTSRFLTSYLTNAGADITPFKELCAKYISPKRIKESTIEFGCVCCSLPFLKEVRVNAKDIEEKDILPFIHASSACAPVFPIEKIEQLRFLNTVQKRDALMFLLMFIPGTPKDLLSYFVPLTDMPLRTWLFITTDGLVSGTKACLRLLGVALPLVLMLMVTKTTDLANACVEKLHIPYKYAFTFTTALRFVPVFSQEMNAIMEAQTARGVEFDTKNPLKRLTLMLPVCIPLLVTSVAKTDATALAAEQRGFYLRTRESSFKRYPFTALDAGAFALCVALIVLGVLL